MFFNDVEAANDDNICNLFANFFQSGYKNLENDRTCEITYNSNQVNCISLPIITEDDIWRGICKLKDGCGSDLIPSSILKNCAPSLLHPLSIIFNISLQQGVFPNLWKTSIIVPIFKSGKRNDVKNYRGISKLSSIPKLFEMIICDYLYFNVKSIFANEQHGFIRQRSTTSNLLIFTGKVSEAFESKTQLDVVYTDFSKAFDSTQFNILLEKLDNSGFGPALLKWIESYLVNRKQRVCINGTLSRHIDVHSGVPQGSHLGPLLFNLFINELPSLFKYSDCLLYADDLKIMKKIENIQHCQELQSDLDLLYNWSCYNKLLLNIDKCKFMTFSMRKIIIEHQYNIGCQVLDRVKIFKDLGVLFDDKMTFRSHINIIVAKANSILGFICRITKDFKKPNSVRSLYCALVRSNLEHAAIIWNPAADTHKNRIERVQKKFILHYLHKINWHFLENVPWWEKLQQLPDYTERCKIANLNSLSTRRDIQAVLFVADILQGTIDAPGILEQLSIHVPHHQSRSISNFIYLPTYKSNYLYNAPISNIFRIFNFYYQYFDFEISKFKLKKCILNNL
ncbi:MAG TPA: hypothetical protein DDZ41_05910 [Flavobacterium sp.]|nr:hypothetical protein [Flavobacterium sp.]